MSAQAFSVVKPMSRKSIITSSRLVVSKNDMWYDETLNHSKWIIHKVTEFSQSITSKRTLDQVTVSSQTRISGITKSRPKNSNAKLKAKVQKFMKAGRADIYRIIHSSLGIASLVIGSSHLFHIAFLHDFLAPITGAGIFLTGSVHCMCGIFGVRRLKLNNKKEAARNAMFWPTMLQNLWFFAASLTEWGRGSHAQFSMFSKPFTLVTVLGITLTIWQLSEVSFKTGIDKTKDSIWFQESWKNALLVEFCYLIWIQIQMGATLFIGTTVSHNDFLDYMNTFPKMHSLLSNLALNTAYFNNLVVFLATLLRYKLVSKPNHDNAVMFALPVITSIFIVWKVLSCFFRAYGGEMSSSFISLLFR